MSGNLGQTGLKRRRRASDPMAAFDGLPAPLRRWLSEAALPWSPRSALRVWSKSRAQGRSPEEALQSLDRAEERTLARERGRHRRMGRAGA